MAGDTRADIAENQKAIVQAAVNLSAVLRAGGLGAEAGLKRVGAELVSQIRRKLSEPGRGRIYQRGRRTHQASAPGQPPAVDTGQLRASYDWRTGNDPNPYLEVGSPLIKAPYLEFGTSRMQARPHFRPAVDEYRGKLTSKIAAEVERDERAAIARLRSGFFKAF